MTSGVSGVVGYTLDPLEIASGMLCGTQVGVAELPVDRDHNPRAAFDACVLRALERPPCIVSFSGGRDSSAILAAAVRIARRRGTDLPVPVTLRFPTSSTADESQWQESLVRHLGLDDWQRVAMTGDLDLIGPQASRLLGRNGLAWPFNAHFFLPLADLAAGGSLLTGVGGDELLQPAHWLRVAKVLGGRIRPEPRDVLRIGLAASPRFVRTAVAVARERRALELPWVRPRPLAQLRRRCADAVAAQPVAFAGALAWWWRSRYRWVADQTLSLIARLAGTAITNPFLDRAVIAAIASDRARVGYDSRAHAMRELFGDVLPPALVNRETKAVLSGVFWTERSWEFARQWRGEGVDHAIVDIDRLRELWTRRDPSHVMTGLLLQRAWLASRSAPRPQTADQSVH